MRCTMRDMSDLLQLLRELLSRPYIRKCGVAIEDDMKALGLFFESQGIPFKAECDPAEYHIAIGLAPRLPGM